MLDRHIERFAESIMFVFIFFMLMLFVPKSNNPTKTNILFYIFSTTFFLYVIIWIYHRIRNMILYYRISKYCNSNNYNKAIDLLDVIISRRPDIPWLRIQRAIILGLEGKLDRFWEEFDLIYNHKPFNKRKYYKFYISFIVISDGLAFINNQSAKLKIYQQSNRKTIEKYLSLPELNLYKSIQAYKDSNMKNSIYYASWMYNESSHTLKLISSFILMSSYQKLGEMDKAILFKKAYLELYRSF